METIKQALANNGFQTIDYIVFAAYIVILVGLGMFLSRKKDGKEQSSTDYFLAGNTLTWWAVGASLIAASLSNTGIAAGIGVSFSMRGAAAGSASAGFALL